MAPGRSRREADLYDSDLVDDVVSLRAKRQKRIWKRAALFAAALLIVFYSPIAYADWVIARAERCVNGANNPLKMGQCLEARGDLWKVRWLPWVRPKVDRAARDVIYKVARRFAKEVPARLLSADLARAAVETQSMAVSEGFDFVPWMAMLGRYADDVVARATTQSSSIATLDVVRAALRIGNFSIARRERGELAARAREAEWAKEAAPLICYCDAISDKTAGNCPKSDDVWQQRAAAVPSAVDLFADDGPLYDPEERGAAATADELRARALGLVQLGRFSEAKVSLVALHLHGAEADARAIDALMSRETLKRAIDTSGPPITNKVTGKVSDETIAKAAANIAQGGFRRAYAALYELAALGAQQEQIEAALIVGLAAPRSVRQQVGLSLLLEQLATAANRSDRADFWAEKRKPLTKLYHAKWRDAFAHLKL